MTDAIEENGPSEQGNVHGQARERLLEAAAKLFSERGYEGVSIREIAREAGVRHGGLNYHFRGKRDLYLEVIQRFCMPDNHVARGGNPQWKAMLKETDASKAEGLIRELLSQTLQGMSLHMNPIAAGLVQNEMMRPDGPSDELFENVIQLKHQALGHLVQLLVPTITDPTELRLISIGMTSQCIAFHFARPVLHRLLEINAKDGMTPELLERIVDRILKTTLHGLLGEQES
ncbi:MAG: AcrR family transcriptional regulator [Planctomycetota bacterium]